MVLNMQEDIHLLAQRIRKLPDEALAKIYSIALVVIQKDVSKLRALLQEVSIVSPVVSESEGSVVSDSVSLVLRKGEEATQTG